MSDLVTRPSGHEAVTWHEVECGSYTADLPLWEELADQAAGSILELGCGTGRVAVHLARRGHRVVGLEADAVLLAACEERAAGLSVELELGDARGFELAPEFALAMAPMQLVQLFAEPAERVACIRCTARHLRPGGKAAFAIVEGVPWGETRPFPLPDVRKVDGWVYSSLPLDAGSSAGAIVVRRLRQTVSPSGELGERIDVVRLHELTAGALELEGREAGLRPIGRREVPADDAHAASTVVVLGREV